MLCRGFWSHLVVAIIMKDHVEGQYRLSAKIFFTFEFNNQRNE